MKFRLVNLLLTGLVVLSTCSAGEQTPLKIWYETPAKSFMEALPLGNGRLGVMVFGDPTRERFQLNDDSLWPADLGWVEPEGRKTDLEHIRSLLFAGKHEEADRLFVEKFSNKKIVRSHQTLGDLYIHFNHQKITEYKRELDLSDATATVSYRSNGDLITEKIFVSHPRRVVLIEISSEAREGLNGRVYLNRPEDDGYPTVTVSTVSENMLVMGGEVTQRKAFFNSKPAPILKGVKFETCLKIVNDDGMILHGDGFLELKNVRRAVFCLVSNSSYYHDDYSRQNKIDLAGFEGRTFKNIKREHVRDYQSLFYRTRLRLTTEDKDSIPTDERLKRIKNGAVDLGMEKLLFDYGRYLLISSSRPGTNPANLQGLWNWHIAAPWNADYHLNINLQMNYWLANLTNLDELNLPLFDYIDKLIVNGKITANKNFGCRGAFIPHATDLWASTWMRAPTAFWGCSLGGGGWLMQHYWSHYQFTQDLEFLKERVLPAMEEVVKFYSDWLIEDPRDGRLISAPSTSPENRFLDKDGKPVATCLGSAMDQQVISELFDNYISACETLKIDTDFLKKIKEQKMKIRPGFVIDSHGRILEWDREYPEAEPGHRHMSHLYGFHPGTNVSRDRTPEIFKAVKKTLEYRLANGGAGTGWSRAWLINCSARLQDGNMAHEHIMLLLKNSISDNLFDMHPPFQIDGNFGYTAGIAEMLLQSHNNEIHLLPALPDVWDSGEVRGLKARGGFEIGLKWEKGQLVQTTILSTTGGICRLRYGESVITLETKPGETHTRKKI